MRDNLVRLDRCKGQGGGQEAAVEKNKQHDSQIDPKKLSILIDKDEEAASDWLNLAAISQRDKNFDEALVFAGKALEAKPDFSLAYKVAGEVLFALNRKRTQKEC